MVFGEVAIDSAHELSEFFLCELVLFSKGLNLCVCFPEFCVCILEPCVCILEPCGCILELFVCFLEKVLDEAKTLVNKSREMADVFLNQVQGPLSFSLSGPQFFHPGIKPGLLLQGPLYVSFESSVEFFVSHK